MMRCTRRCRVDGWRFSPVCGAQVDYVAAEGTRMVSEIVHATHRAGTGERLIGWVLLGAVEVSVSIAGPRRRLGTRGVAVVAGCSGDERVGRPQLGDVAA